MKIIIKTQLQSFCFAPLQCNNLARWIKRKIDVYYIVSKSIVTQVDPRTKDSPLGVNTTADSGGFVRFRHKLVGVRSENFFTGGQSLLLTDPIEEFQFSTDWPTERPKTNSTIDSIDSDRNRLDFGQKFFPIDSRNFLFSNPIGKIWSPNEHPYPPLDTTILTSPCFWHLFFELPFPKL